MTCSICGPELTQQIFAGNAFLRDSCGDGRDVPREDVGLAHDNGRGRRVEGAEGGRVALPASLVQLQHGQLHATVLHVPQIVLPHK